ncbi:MAG: GDSL-type esterase/lipase family protein [Burkholderiaceae bacterium]|nr:GDSL-type esterase/lipase family protein [Burkholderiaceae bacterium]
MRLPLLLVLVVAGALLGAAGCTAWRIGEASALARRSTPLQHTPADATLRLLIVGDSTGVGTGASAPPASLAGLLASDYPRLWIENRARDGATFADTADQLAGDARFDVVLVLAGGNDVIRLRAPDALRADIERTVALARERGEVVVLMPGCTLATGCTRATPATASGTGPSSNRPVSPSGCRPRPARRRRTAASPRRERCRAAPRPAAWRRPAGPVSAWPPSRRS